MTEYFFETAQICEKGHLRNDEVQQHPNRNEKFCSLCDSKVISECTKCKTPIRAHYYAQEAMYQPVCGYYDPLKSDQEHKMKFTGYNRKRLTNELHIPSFCYHCGHPFPWTELFLKTADEMVDMFDELTLEQKQELKATFPDLIVETPSSKLSALKASKIINGFQSFGKDFFISFLKDGTIQSLFMLMNLK